MPNYDFMKEVETIIRDQGRPGSFDGFYEKLVKLAGNEARRFPPTIVDPILTHWTEEAYKELADDFCAYFLCTPSKGKQHKSRMDYLIAVTRKNLKNPCAGIDFLVSKMFRQYLASLMDKMLPYKANIFHRMRKVLKVLDGAGCIETRVRRGRGNRKLSTDYRTTAAPENDFVAQETLSALSEDDLPPWKSLRFNPDSESLSSSIGNDDLQRIVGTIFDLHPGWIEEPVLRSFLFILLRVQDVAFVPAVIQGPEREELSLLEITEALGIDVPPDLLIRLAQAYERMSPRQQAIFIYHCYEGLSVDQICALRDYRKSTVHAEIVKIRGIIEDELAD